MTEDIKDYKGRLYFGEYDCHIAIRKVPTTEGEEMEVIARGDRDCLLGMVEDGSFPNGTRVYQLVGEPDAPTTKKKNRRADDLLTRIP